MTTFVPSTHCFDPALRDRVRDASPIDQVINADLVAAGHRPLVGSGEELQGWHPLHGSQSGLSLKVNRAKGLYYCFNCGEGGDVFTWVMRERGITFVETLQFLAARAGIPLPSLDPAQLHRWHTLQQDRHDLEELFRAVAEFYYQQIRQEQIDFCQAQWGLSPETIQRYKLGFAPVAPDALQHQLRWQGFADELIQKSGLVIQVGNRWHDFFQGRLIFPYWRDLPDAISGVPGTPLYFIGRCIDGTTLDKAWEKAKYKKQLVHGAKHPYVSPTVTNTYFYAEHVLRVLKGRPLLVTEGVADCVAALQANLPSISPVTVRFSQVCYPPLLQLARRAPRILICNDNEDSQAGTKGALDTAAFLDAAGIDVRIVTLPRSPGVQKIDLADFLKQHSAEAFQRLCEAAPAYLDARLATSPVSTDGFTNCQTAHQFVTEILRHCPDEARALAFLRYRVKEYFGLRAADIDGLVRVYHDQQRQNTHRRPPGGSSVEDAEDAGDSNGLLAHVGGAEDLESLAAGACQDNDARPLEVRYRATRHGLVGEKPTKDGSTDVLLTNFTAIITAEITRDDGAETRKRFALTVTLKDQTYSLDIPEAQFAGMGWVTEYVGAHAIMMAGMTLKDHARTAIQILSQHIAHRYVFEHTGWRVIDGERYYLHHSGAITAQGGRDDIRVALSGALARYQLPAPPTGAARIAAITASLALRALLPARGMMPVLGVVYLAPLRELLSAEPPDFTVWLHGRSGLFKSEDAALAQAHWGDFSRLTLPASFIATGNALERLMFATKDALLVCDDYFPARNKREADAMDQTAARLLRGIGNGSSHQRMRQDTTLRPDLPPRGVTLATGERLLEGYSTNARLFLLSLTPAAQEDIASRLTKAQEQKAQYPLAMSAYIQWIAQHWDTLQDTLPKRFQELRQLAYAPGNHFRQPAQMAYLQLAWETFTTFALQIGALDTDTRTTLLQECWEMLTTTARQQSTALQEEAPERRFLALLADGFASKRTYLADLNGDCPTDGDAWGWVRVTRHDKDGNAYHEWQRPSQGTLLGHADEHWLYLFPEQAYQFVAKAARDANSVFPVELTTLLKHLADGSMITTAIEAGQVRRTVKQRIGNGAPRVIKLRRTALAGVFPGIQGTGTPQGIPQGTAQPLDFSNSCNDQKAPVPSVPWDGALESYTRTPDTHGHTPEATDENDRQPVPIHDSLTMPGNRGDTGNTQPESFATTEGNRVPWCEDATGDTGYRGNAPAPELSPRCGANHMTLVQHQGQPACVDCSTLSDAEIARIRASLLASTLAPSVPPAVPPAANGTHPPQETRHQPPGPREVFEI